MSRGVGPRQGLRKESKGMDENSGVAIARKEAFDQLITKASGYDGEGTRKAEDKRRAEG